MSESFSSPSEPSGGGSSPGGVASVSGGGGSSAGPTPPPRRIAPSSSRRSAQSPMREKVLDVLKTLIWVIPLTILIWVYAEREQSVELKNVTIRVGVRINNSGKIVTLRDPAVTATVSGPQTNVRDFLRQLGERPDQSALTHTIDPSTPAGEIQIPASVLNEDSRLVRNGITLADISPRSLQATVDDLVTDELPVRMPVKIAGLEGEPRFTPETVKVTAPRSLFDEARRLQRVSKPYLSVDLTKVSESKLPGAHDVSVPLLVGVFAAPHVTISAPDVNGAPTVSAHFTVRQTLETYTFHNVTVWPAAPGSWFKTHDAEVTGSQQTLEAVTLEGPPEKIAEVKAAIEQGQTDLITAYVHVGDIDVNREDVKPVMFRLPDGTHLAPGQRKFEVTVRVTQRAG